MRLVNSILFLILTSWFVYIIYGRLQKFREDRIDLDELLWLSNKLSDHIPRDARIFYLSNYKSDHAAARYFQAQFALAPRIVVDSDVGEGDYIFVVIAKNPDLIVQEPVTVPPMADSITTAFGQGCDIKLFKKNKR